MAQYITNTQFGGLNRNDQLIVPINAPNPPYNRVENFRGMVDYASSDETNYTPVVGMITKSPQPVSWKGTMPAAGRTRGLFQFVPNIVDIATKNYLVAYQVTTDYTISKLYALDIVNNAWYTLYTGSTYYPADAEVYNGNIYMLLDGDFRKWNGDITNWATVAPKVNDKGGTAVAIATATITWNGTVTVTSSSDITATVLKGMLIRRSSSSLYWDEVLSVAAGGLTITLSAASSDTGASAAGGAQRAAYFSALNVQPWFIKFWKNKMWLCGNNDTLYYSVAGDPENWSDTTLGAGGIDLSSLNQEGVSGIEFIDDYLIVFRDFSYLVYTWTGDLDEPIQLVREVPRGCISNRSIQKTPNGIIYLSDGDLRITTANDDNSLADSMLTAFRTTYGGNRHYYYWLSGANSNSYPWSILDKNRGIYSLHIPQTTGVTKVINYDYVKNQFLGTDYYYTAGHGCMVYEGAGSIPTFVFASSASSNQLKQFYSYGGDFSTSGKLESAIFYSGVASKKLKIHWVEFDFHPTLGNGTIDTTVVFNYRKDFQAVDTTKNQTYDLDYTVITNLDRAYICDTKRFYVNEECKYFSWVLSETFGAAAADDIGIMGVTISFDLIDNP